MAALEVAYLLAGVSRDSIDNRIVELLPDLQILALSDAVTAPQHFYSSILIRLYTADDDLPSLLDCAIRLVGANGSILVISSPEAESRVVAALDAGVDDYLLATSLQLERLPRLIKRAATRVQIASDRDQAQAALHLQYQRQQALGEVAKALADISLNETVALQQAAQHVAKLLGDACAIMLMAEDQQQLEIAALYHLDPQVVALSRDLFGMLRFPANEPIMASLLTHGQSVILNSDQIAQLPSVYQQGLRADHAQVGLSGLMFVPLRTQHATIGVMISVCNQPNRQYTDDDLAFFWEIAEGVALSIANLRLFQRSQRELVARQFAEESLRRAEMHYRMVVENLPLAISTINLDQPGERPYISPQIRELLGYSVEEWYAQPDLWRRQAHPEDLPIVMAAAIAAGESGTFQVEHRQFHRDGHVVWVRYDQRIIMADQKRVLLATMRDVTQRKQAEAALHESNERYDLAVQGSSDGIWDWNLQTDVAYFSPRFRELMGYGLAPHHSGMTILDNVVHPDDKEHTIAALNAHLTERIPFSIECRLSTFSNGYRWFLMRGQALWNAEGLPIRMAGSLTDIHDAKSAHTQLAELNRTLEQRIADRTVQLEQTLSELRDNEQRLRTVVSNISIILFSLDSDGIFTLSEGRGLAALGLIPQQAVGLSIFQIYQDRPDLLADVRRALAGEQFRTISAIGDHVFETWYTPLIQSDDRIDGTIGVLADITARQQAEHELHMRSADLLRANRELARSARLKDEFLANMSHELRTPLTSILGRSELLQEDTSGVLTDFQRRSLRSIEESGTHLLRLINDILDLSKIGAGKITLSSDRVIVAELCLTAIRMSQEIAFRRHLTIQTSFDPAVVSITADERRLKQILINLLSNAVKFTPPGRTIGITVRGDPVAQEAHFTVWDTGIGITIEDQARLFQPFVQIDSSLTRQYEGTGLGLVLVAHLTAMHSGRVTLDSVIDQGSRFTITLPWICAS